MNETKNPAAVALGRLGGAASARHPRRAIINRANAIKGWAKRPRRKPQPIPKWMIETASEHGTPNPNAPGFVKFARSTKPCECQACVAVRNGAKELAPGSAVE